MTGYNIPVAVLPTIDRGVGGRWDPIEHAFSLLPLPSVDAPEQGPSRYWYFPRLMPGAGGLWDPTQEAVASVTGSRIFGTRHLGAADLWRAGVEGVKVHGGVARFSGGGTG